MSSSDNSAPLYAKHEPVFPRRVSGKFRNLKWWIMALTLGVYYLTPWIRWDRGPQLPDQAVLIDMAGRRFYFLWIEIWPHEFYFIAGLLIMAGLGLFLFTSALGRVWCGYTCPQTVWTDLFILTERWIEGDRNARVRLWNAKWDFRKWKLRLVKWAVWIVIGVGTGGAWVFYFMDAPTLFRDLFTLSAHPVAYTTIAILGLLTVLFGGFAREQVCIYMCPWPRIQSAMMDEDTLVVAYRDWRGEPRGKPSKARAGVDLGDCIDCKACVTVCPVGIDIREGQQLACITCALCIDACDDIMDKIGKPRGLIDYMALTDESSEREGGEPKPVWKHVLRPRTILYTSLWSLVGIALVFALFIRADIDLTVRPIRNPLYVTMSDGAIRNTYDVRLRNKNGDDRLFEMTISSESPLIIELEGSDDGISVIVPADESKLQRVYVVAPAGSEVAHTDRTNVRLWVEDTVSGERTSKVAVFNGAGK